MSLKWQFPSDSMLNLSPATDGTQVYLPLAKGSLVCLRVTDGKLVWRAETGGEISASPVADMREVYAASLVLENPESQKALRGTVRALSRLSGVTNWLKAFPSSLQGTLTENATSLLGGFSDGRVYSILKNTGDAEWAVTLPDSFSSKPFSDHGQLYIGSEKGVLWVLDEHSGKQVWRYQTQGGPISGQASVTAREVVFGSGDGYVYSLEKKGGGLRWRTRTGAGVQSVAIDGERVIAGSLDNFVYAMSLRNGDRIWKHQLAGRILAQPLIVQDNALFVPLAGNSCVVLNAREGKEVNSFQVGDGQNTGASPVIAANSVLISTRLSLMAFSPVSAPSR